MATKREQVINKFFSILKETTLEKPISSLDGIRAISILLVLLGHSSFLYSEDFFIFSKLFSILQSTGVSTFFVLSGYLITTLLLKEIKKSGFISFKSFYIKRLFRIIPPFYSYVIFILFFANIDPFPGQVEIISAILFIWNYVLETKNWYLGHSWSLSVEEQFYMIWPFFLKRLKSNLNAKKVILLVIIITPFIRVLSYHFFPELRGRLSILFHTRVDTLMFGCLLAFLNEDSIKRFYQKIKKYKLGLLSFLLIVFVAPIATFYFAGKYLMTVGYTLEGISISIIFICIFELNRSDKFFKFLNSKVLTHIGSLSYGLYIWQQYFLSKEYAYSTSSRYYFLYIVAIFSYFLVEYPSKILCQKVLSKERPQL